MAFTLFGWLLPRKQQPVVNPVPVTTMVDGSTTINSGQMSGYYGFSFDLDGNVRNEIQMINRYREVASYPDCDTAIEHIVNEAVIVDQTKPPVSINLDNLPEQYNDQFRQRVREQFDQVIKLLNFNEQCHDIFKRWYVDGKLYYYITIDPKNPTDGILELKYVDPRKIRKVTEYVKETTDKGFEVVKDIHQYYIFNDDGLENAQDGIKLALDNVIQVKSGIIDANSGEVISYLYKAIKPVNQLKMMEDALVIYRITRAPERRIFYIDVGNMPNQKAEQYVQNIMTKFRNKVVYNSETGEITNNRNYMSMQEDFWLPRREGGRATEIQTLPPGQALNEIADIEYFQHKLYQSLNVPRQRLLPETNFSLGTTAEITREEVAFNKFIQRLRNNFNVLLREALKVQMVLTKTCTMEEWEELGNLIFFEYQHDNYFEELKRVEILNERMTLLQTADGFKDTYFSKEWIVKNILQMTDDEWKAIKEQIADETHQDDQSLDELGSFESSEDQDEPNNLDMEDGQSYIPSDNQEEQKAEPTDDIEPNAGDDDFDRGAEPGLKVVK